jgi:tetratricopeptide (TPR) repeat protein
MDSGPAPSGASRNDETPSYGSKGEDDQALADDSKAIELDPNYVSAYSNRGIARGNKGDLDAAIADVTRAVEIDPQYAWGFMSRGILHSKRREPGPAHADFGKAIEIDPNCAFAYALRGETYLRNGDDERAFADESKADRMTPASLSGRCCASPGEQAANGRALLPLIARQQSLHRARPSRQFPFARGLAHRGLEAMFEPPVVGEL